MRHFEAAASLTGDDGCYVSISASSKGVRTTVTVTNESPEQILLARLALHLPQLNTI